MPRIHFLLLLVVVLSLCTLATANSIPASMVPLDTGAGIPVDAFTVPGHVPIYSGNSTSVMFALVNDRTPDDRTVRLFGPIAGENGASYTTGRVVSSARLNTGPFCCKAQDWHWGGHHSTVTAEPDSLILLATGLIGVAGTVRRKLARS